MQNASKHIKTLIKVHVQHLVTNVWHMLHAYIACDVMPGIACQLLSSRWCFATSLNWFMYLS